MAKNRLLCLDEVFFIILNNNVYKYKHFVYIIIMNLTKGENKMRDITITINEKELIDLIIALNNYNTLKLASHSVLKGVKVYYNPPNNSR